MDQTAIELDVVKSEGTIKVQFEHEISLTAIGDLLVTAFEGGSNYWVGQVKLVKPEKITFAYDSTHIIKIYTYPLNEGGAVLIQPQEEEEWHTLNLESIRKGFAIMAVKHTKTLAEILSHNADAGTADVFLQLCLFGDVIYG